MENWSWRPVKFWTVEWTGIVLLEWYALYPLDQSQKIDLVLDFLQENGWNFEKLCSVLPIEVIQRNLGINVAIFEVLWIKQSRLLVIMVGSQLVLLTLSMLKMIMILSGDGALFGWLTFLKIIDLPVDSVMGMGNS